jgi:DNA-binding MarR family transcriptional regulator
MKQMPGPGHHACRPGFTPRQGQYLAFIYPYTQRHGRPPAAADLQRYFRVSPPSVHQMVLTLERIGLIKRQPGLPRSIQLLVEPVAPPILRSAENQPVKSSVQRC